MSVDPSPVTDWLLFFIAVSTVIGLFARWIAKGAKRREMNAQHQRDEMVALIKEVTYQIQPKSNGGLSLSDLHGKVDTIAGQVEVLVERQEQVVTEVSLLKSAVLQLEDDVEGILR